ncbi:MAG: flavodoxin family protein [Spirochaetales bacterium]|nr:flavodoxin family protein [Spirochaetales bacterium]
MKILAIVGSRRKNGNTAALVERALEPFREDGSDIEIIYPGELNIEGCSGCEGCSKTGLCVVNDDMQPIYRKILEADAIIAGSPTYFYNMTSDMKKFIDRCYCFFSFDKNDRSVWISRLSKGKLKLAGLFAICEQNSSEDMGYTSDAMKSAFEALGFRIVFTQKVLHVFKAGDILKNENDLRTAFGNGLKLLKTLKLNS